MIGELAEVLDDGDDDPVSNNATWGLALCVTGIVIMAAGGILAVQGAERVVDALSVSDTAVGLTLVALATTAELVALAFASARRNVSELAVAAVVGSAAYNSTATLGAAALVHPVGGLDVRAAAVVAAALPLVVLVLGGRQQRLPRAAGAALVEHVRSVRRRRIALAPRHVGVHRRLWSRVPSSAPAITHRASGRAGGSSSLDYPTGRMTRYKTVRHSATGHLLVIEPPQNAPSGACAADEPLQGSSAPGSRRRAGWRQSRIRDGDHPEGGMRPRPPR